ncbi:hypothetical protein Athai_64250 [Actinocatenispora thailandica]|uniref:Uncharacterized protein n=1 Tax=Actinocatenispora thailandica TaxID=227318 RepID=A0A7R7DW14_9ACTN|nr:hypothetical protein Athai_64250 [Actinocatenispora thailandica]
MWSFLPRSHPVRLGPGAPRPFAPPSWSFLAALVAPDKAGPGGPQPFSAFFVVVPGLAGSGRGGRHTGLRSGEHRLVPFYGSDRAAGSSPRRFGAERRTDLLPRKVRGRLVHRG